MATVTFGTAILAGLKALGIFASLVVVLALFANFALPNVLIPSDLLNFLIGSNFKKVMNLIYYFVPVDFALSCLGLIYSVKLLIIIWKLAVRTVSIILNAKK